MDSIFKICQFQNGPITDTNYVVSLEQILRSGVSPTITTKDVETFQAQKEEDEDYEQETNGTTPLHAICSSVDPSISGSELQAVSKMIDLLFEWGAGWMILNEDDETPGCIALRRKLDGSIYKKFVQAGTRAEVLLRRITISEPVEEEEEAQPSNTTETEQSEVDNDPALHQKSYLASELAYTDHALVTKSQNDGVMMDWETPIMKRSAEIITIDSDSDETGPVVLNVGFGMGIIDTYIQSLKPKAHYICEAHPDVLAKMKADGWYDRPGVVVLEGRWQDSLAKLLNKGNVFFDGMYYDTFSEHYSDLVDFFDSVVGLLKGNGVFSFFNGLGADRQICYDVYCEVLEVDLLDYGLEVSFETWPVPSEVVNDKSQVWKGIRKQYWAVKDYKLPLIKFIGA